jgi:hypothetical protein
MCGTIRVRTKTPGVFLPVCHMAELFCALIQSNTIDSHRLDSIRNLGYSIEIINTGVHSEKID